MQETEMDFESRIVTSDFTPEDNDIENSLRPKVLDDYIGQDKVKENLAVYIQAARGRGEALDHVLLYGPPGLGKTTLAGVIANEMGVNLRVTSGPAIEKQGDLAALLTNLQEGDVLFIDEIHRLNRQVEEVLYPAMEDGALDIIIGKGPSARSIRLDLPHFTLKFKNYSFSRFLSDALRCSNRLSITGCYAKCKPVGSEFGKNCDSRLRTDTRYGNKKLKSIKLGSGGKGIQIHCVLTNCKVSKYIYFLADFAKLLSSVK